MIVRDERFAGYLRLELSNVLRFGVVHVGELVLTGVTAIEVSSERPFDRVIDDTRMIGDIVRCRFDEGRAVIDVHRQTGPGDEDEFRFLIHCAGMDLRLRASLLRSIFRLAGL